jgi:hypothetical protein
MALVNMLNFLQDDWDAAQRTALLRDLRLLSEQNAELPFFQNLKGLLWPPQATEE